MLTASVVVSCYNQEAYIEECLDSILAQNIDFECEVIVSDDCSTDNTQTVLKAYNEKNKGRIKLLLRDENVGAALNYVGVHNEAVNDLVFHIDGDDVMLPGKLQSQFNVFTQNSDVNVVFHKATYFSDSGVYNSSTSFPEKRASEVLFFSLEELARWGTVAVHSSYAYRRNSRKTREIKREFMEWFFAMDSLLPNGKGAFINHNYVNYRCNPSGGEHSAYTGTRSGAIKAYLIYFEDIYDLFEKNSNLRLDLYANFLVSFIAMSKLTRSCTFKGVKFLLKNIFYCRWAKLLDTVNVRRTVGPQEKIR